MKVLIILALLIPVSTGISLAQDVDWAIEGKVISADNCAIGCPCIFGEPPSHGRCTYTGILIIEKGHYGEVNLDGVKFGLGGAFGRSAEMAAQEYDFVAYYIDSRASAKQKDALKKILGSKVFEPLGKPSEIKEAPISVTGIEHFAQPGKTYAVAAGDFLKVQVTPVSGAMSGQPIVIENSAEPLFYWTALGKTSDSYFKGAGQNWTFNGTSGESHKFALSSSGAMGPSMKKGHH